MSTFRQFILFYLLEVLALALIVFIVTGRFIPLIAGPYLWVGVALLTALGLLIGFIIYELRLKPVKKNSKYIRWDILLGLPLTCYYWFLVLRMKKKMRLQT